MLYLLVQMGPLESDIDRAIPGLVLGLGSEVWTRQGGTDRNPTSRDGA